MQAVSVDMTERVDVAEDVSDVETEEDSIKEEATVTTEENTDLTEQEQAVETEKKEALTQTISEEDVPVNPQEPTTQESSTQEPTEQTPATDETETDERGNPADGSPVFEITFNIPQAEYVGYDMSTLFWTYFYRTIYINFHEFVCYFKIIYLFQSRVNKLAITRP